MTIRLLGTGAAEGIPAFYSDTEVSQYARQHGGKDIRTRSGALVDGTLKIDLPPDTLLHLNRDRLDAMDWSALVFTHSHDDHFAPAELQYCLYPFNEMDFLDFVIYGNEEICSRIHDMYPSWPMNIEQTSSFRCFRHEDYLITPIHANHKLDEDAHNLIIQKDNGTLLYGTDTGIWFEETWEFLKDFKVDLLVIECTEGFKCTDYHGHLDIRSCLEVIERLNQMGIIDSKTQISTTHHSHNGAATHSQLEEVLTPYGIEVGFDGKEITI